MLLVLSEEKAIAQSPGKADRGNMSGDPVFYGPWSLTIEAGLGLVGIVANSICAHHTRSKTYKIILFLAAN